MSWFRIDDSFYDHPKVADLPDSALALWVRAGTYSARHLTDGSVSRRTANRLCDEPDEAIAALLKAGLWIEDGDGAFRFHDWHVYQPTAAEAKATRDARSIGGQVGNHDRWHVRKGKTDPNCVYCRSTDRSTDRSGDRSTDRVPEGVTESGANRMRIPRPDPTRPDPVSSKSKPGGVDLGLSPTRQDQSEVEEEEPAPTGIYALPKAWCNEHGCPNDRDCTGCLQDYGDVAHYAKLRLKGGPTG